MLYCHNHHHSNLYVSDTNLSRALLPLVISFRLVDLVDLDMSYVRAEAVKVTVMYSDCNM